MFESVPLSTNLCCQMLHLHNGKKLNTYKMTGMPHTYKHIVIKTYRDVTTRFGTEITTVSSQIHLGVSPLEL